MTAEVQQRPLGLALRTSALAESPLDVRCSLKTALADVTKNSIIADPRNIRMVEASFDEFPVIQVLGDSIMMSEEELTLVT